MRKLVVTILIASVALLPSAFADLSLVGLMRYHHSLTGHRLHDVYLLRPNR